MKQRYTIGNYVKISQLDEQGNATTFLAEAEMPLKVTVGKELQVRPCERGAEWINLGIVSEARNYKKRTISRSAQTKVGTLLWSMPDLKA